MNYGLPYQGSKSKIAPYIIDILPAGNRFVDLFGGGGAMTHCALLSNKYKQVYYNELNKIVVDLIKKAINGDFNYNKFKPEFITRDKFNELKDKDGYIKYIWSFSNGGNNYLFGKNIEKEKELIHNFIVFNSIEGRNFLKQILVCEEEELNFIERIKNIREKRLSLKKLFNKYKKRLDTERLQQLQQLERLELNIGSYLDYQYKDGDVVYCDPPYEGTVGYNKKIIIGTTRRFSELACSGKGRYYDKQIIECFNHREFYDWVATRPFTVYFSSYEITDKRFFIIGKKEKINLMSGNKNQKKVIEYIYCNQKIRTNLFN